MITKMASGACKIELYAPFDIEGAEVSSITLGPFKFDHTLRWRDGEFSSTLALMTELADCNEAVLRNIRGPDIDRVLDEFMRLVPPEIRDDIASGSIPMPLAREEPTPPPEEQPQGLVLPAEEPAEEAGGGHDPMGVGLSLEPSQSR